MNNKELAKQFGIDYKLLDKLDEARPIFNKKMTEKITKSFLALIMKCKQKPKS